MTLVESNTGFQNATVEKIYKSLGPFKFDQVVFQDFNLEEKGF